MQHAHTRYNGLHLVTATSKSKNGEADTGKDDKKERQTAAGLLRYQGLLDEFDDQVLSDVPDLDRVLQLKAEMDILRETLHARGVRVAR
jgi:hypothetical protein